MSLFLTISDVSQQTVRLSENKIEEVADDGFHQNVTKLTEYLSNLIRIHSYSKGIRTPSGSRNAWDAAWNDSIELYCTKHTGVASRVASQVAR